MPLFALLPPKTGRGPRTDQPVSMWPYIAAAFVSSTSLLGTAVLVKLRWGVAVPLPLFGLASVCVSTGLAAYLFFANQSRPLFRVERRWLTFGCFLAFWFYDGFVRITLTFIHGEETPLDTISEIGGTLFDFAVVWMIVRVLAFWGTKRYRVLDTEHA
jgi:hypothetical protein